MGRLHSVAGGSTGVNSYKRKAAWILPDFAEGSGGHRTIFQNITYLSEHGYKNDVYAEDNGHFKNTQDLKQKAAKYFGDCKCSFFLGYRIRGTYDIVFATSWKTASIVDACSCGAKKAYFVQDYEAYFYPMGEQYLAACRSYSYDLHFITIGRWLSQKLFREYGQPSRYFDFCADPDIYFDMGHKRKKAVCFLYQPEKPRRCSRLGIEALRIVKQLRPDVDIYLYGSAFRERIGFEHTNLKLISAEACNKLYNDCSVGLCISASNPSRVPFEMMAAGLPAVDLYLENNLYDMPPNMSLAMYEPKAVAKAILHILEYPEFAKQMSEDGKDYMREKTLEYGFEQFYQAVEHIVGGDADDVAKDTSMMPIEKIYQKAPVTASRKQKETAFVPAVEDRTSVLIRRLKRNRILRNSRLIRSIYLKFR